MQFPLTIVCHTLTSSSYLNGIGRSLLPGRGVTPLFLFSLKDEVMMHQVMVKWRA